MIYILGIQMVDIGEQDIKDRILKYLKKRKKGAWKMLETIYNRTGKINPIILEVALTYKALISDIKHERLD